MSWLKGTSLSNIKEQISSFTREVLADAEDQATPSISTSSDWNADIHKLRSLLDEKDRQILTLSNLNNRLKCQLEASDAVNQTLQCQEQFTSSCKDEPKDDTQKSAWDDDWGDVCLEDSSSEESFKVKARVDRNDEVQKYCDEINLLQSERDRLISQVEQLGDEVACVRHENRELSASLEELNSQCQREIDKIISVKNEIQAENSELKLKYNLLQKQYEVVQKELENAKNVEPIEFATTASQTDVRCTLLSNKVPEKSYDLLLNDYEVLKMRLDEMQNSRSSSATSDAATSSGQDNVQSLRKNQVNSEAGSEWVSSQATIVDANITISEKSDAECQTESTKDVTSSQDSNDGKEENASMWVESDAIKKLLETQLRNIVRHVMASQSFVIDPKMNDEQLRKLIKKHIAQEADEYVEMIAKLSELQKINEQLNSRVSALEAVECQRDDLKMENDLLRGKMDAIFDQIKIKEKELTKLREELDISKAEEEVTNVKSAEIDDLRKEKQDISDQLLKIREELEGKETEIENYKVKLVDSQITLEKLRIAVDEKTNLVEDLEAARVTDRNEAAELENKNSNLDSELQNVNLKNKELENAIVLLSNERDCSKEELEKLRREMENKTENDSSDERITQLETEVDELRNFRTDFVAMSEKYDDLKSYFEKGCQQITALESQKCDLISEVEKLREKLENSEANLENFKAKYENTRQAYVEFEETKRREFSDSKKDKENLEENLEEMKKLLELSQAKLVESDNQISSLSELKLKDEDTIKKLANIVKDYKKQVETLSMELENSRTQSDGDKNVYDEQKKEIEQLKKEMQVIKESAKILSAERDEVIESLQLKHHESMMYHEKLQNATAALNVETAKNAELMAEKEELASQVMKYRTEISDMETGIVEAHRMLNAEKAKLTESAVVNELTAKLESLNKEKDELTNELQRERSSSHLIQVENENLSKEIDRLRKHLVSVEDGYTTEIMNYQKNLELLESQRNQMEEKLKSTSATYTSISVRTNQKVESLENQVQTLTKQNRDFRSQLKTAEENAQRHLVELYNLQTVLDIFEKNKNNDIASATEKLRIELKSLEDQNAQLKMELSSTYLQVEEYRTNASEVQEMTTRLDKKERELKELQIEVSDLRRTLEKTERRLEGLRTGTDGKVDKSLIKNLIIGYMNAPSSSKIEALRILSSVLDMTTADKQRIGLAKEDTKTNQSLAAEFIKFLERESDTHQMAAGTEDNSQSHVHNQPLSEPFLPTLQFQLGENSSSILRDVLKSDDAP